MPRSKYRCLQRRVRLRSPPTPLLVICRKCILLSSDIGIVLSVNYTDVSFIQNVWRES